MNEIISAKRTVTPRSIKLSMGSKHSKFAGFEQQDSHEFISQCLEELEQEESPKNNYYEQIDYTEFAKLSISDAHQ